MLGRMRQTALLIVGIVIGYALGTGPFAEWTVDVCNQLAIGWATERLSRGPSGTLPLLFAGFLIGQGLFLLARIGIRKIGPLQVQRSERLATWDVSLKLATRFGLHQYLERCVNWATEDPTARTQCLALFKIRGLGQLNEKKGTLATSALLQQIATEVRAASLPDSVSMLRRWLTHHFPRPVSPSASGVPPARYAARWSGATFALAFRELDAVQVVAITRDLLLWIRKLLENEVTASNLSVRSVVVVGSPSVTARGLTSSAVVDLASGSDASNLKVLCDPADVRSTVISQMSDVQHVAVSLEKLNPDAVPTPSPHHSWRTWTRSWGPALGCLLAAWLLLQLTSSKASNAASYFPLPESVTELPILDQNGSKVVHIVRSRLTKQQSDNWSLSDGLLIQSDPKDGNLYPGCQIHITITNISEHNFYVSAYDFKAVDESGRRIGFAPERMLRMTEGITGRWLAPGETWTGWLITVRQAAPIVSLEFTPDRFTRLTLNQIDNNVITRR